MQNGVLNDTTQNGQRHSETGFYVPTNVEYIRKNVDEVYHCKKIS